MEGWGVYKLLDDLLNPDSDSRGKGVEKSDIAVGPDEKTGIYEGEA